MKLPLLPDFDPSLYAPMELDLRVVIKWDTDLCDVELRVQEPTGQALSAFQNIGRTGGLLSKNFTNGLGPQEYALRTAIPGCYRFSAVLFHSNASIGDGVLVSVTVQTRTREESVIVLLKNLKEEVLLGTVEFSSPLEAH